MAVSTDKLIPWVLPPKEEITGVDFLKILDDFDPSLLSKEVLNAFAARDPFVTAYGGESQYYRYEGVVYPVPDDPAEYRLSAGRSVAKHDREDLIAQVGKYNLGLSNGYKNCRRALIKAIGSKACAYIVEKEVESLSENQKDQQKADFERWEKYLEEERNNRFYEESEEDWYFGRPVSVSEKVVRVRKGIRKSDGRYFTQRDFAKLIEYPVQKYAGAEKDDAMVDDVLLEKLIMICHANPYYLYDDECYADMGEYEGNAVDLGDAPAIIVNLEVIYKWIQEGKPRTTYWGDGVTEYAQ